MAISRTDLKAKILRQLHKTATFKGAYTDDKLNDAIEEAMDFIATELALGPDNGFQGDIDYLSPAAAATSATVPALTMMIRELRFWDGARYVPMTYDAKLGKNSEGDGGGLTGAETQDGNTYRLVGNTILFDPPLATGGTNYLQLDLIKYPTAMTIDADTTPASWGKAMEHYLKYRAASILATTTEKMAIPWAGYEAQWHTRLQDLAAKRKMAPTPIREFGS